MGCMNSSMKLHRKCQMLSSFHLCCKRGACWQSSSWCGGFNCHPELMIHRFLSFHSLFLGESWMSCWQLKPNSSNSELFICPSKSSSLLLFPLMLTAPLLPCVPQAHNTGDTYHSSISKVSWNASAFLCAASLECIFPLFLPLTVNIASISTAFLTFCLVSPYVNMGGPTTTCVSSPFHASPRKHSPWSGWPVKT